MGEESPKPASTPTGAVFLSYASEDAAAAERIAVALRGAGIQVWFDREELRGGDSWDRQIRQQIHDCRLFIAMVSAHTEARDEGYFRREWRLAVERAGDMAEGKAFLVPVVIDSTTERTAAVPDKFRELQWTRLPDGEAPPAFVERVRRLLSPGASSAQLAATPLSLTSTVRSSGGKVTPSWRSKGARWVAGAVVAVAVAYIALDRFLVSRHAAPPAKLPAQTAAPAPATATAFNPPPHSIAVLPFVNMSGDKEQDYFSDGLSEELLNSLARINELQVAARTSSFYFKGEHADLATIAHKLNVASVLEGSVRRSGHTVRVTAQLNNAVTGYHLWSQTYDRDLDDALKMQSDIANAVANALKVTLLGDVAAKIAVGRTRNPAALDAYLRATNAYWTAQTKQEEESAIAGYTEVIRLDPDYALAYADRSFAVTDFAGNNAHGAELRDSLEKARTDADKAIALAPDLGDGHFALGFFFESIIDYPRATEEYEHALALAPGNAKLLSIYGQFAVRMGKTDAGLAAARRSVVLDPLNPWYHIWLGGSLQLARRYGEAIAAYRDAKAIAPNDVNVNGTANGWIGWAYYSSGEFESARSACEAADEDEQLVCFALTYSKLGQHSAAETMLARLEASPYGAAHPVLAAGIYAQWGDTIRALDRLGAAMRLRDPFLVNVKTFDWFDPLRKEPRFQAIEQELKFPSN